MLDTAHVLTCAHVVAAADDHIPGRDGQAPKTEVTVEFPLWSVEARARATVVDGGWVEQSDDERGDVALLRLIQAPRSGDLADHHFRDRGLPEWWSAPLDRRSPRWRQRVRVYGFPTDMAGGIWVDASLMGLGGPGGEWAQMDTLSGARVTRGFSGSAVIDTEFGAVAGIVVSEYTDGTAGLAWMMPLETLEKSSTKIRSVVAQRAKVRSRAGPRVKEFLADRTASGTMVVVASPQPPAGIIAAPSPSESLRISHDLLLEVAQNPTLVDIAVDATGLRTDDIARGMVAQLGYSISTEADPVEPLLIVLTGTNLLIKNIDAAIDPKGLVRALIRRLCRRAIARRNRLLLGFSDEHASIEHRVRLLRAQLEDAVVREDWAREQLDPIGSLERDGYSAAELRTRLSLLARSDASRTDMLRGIAELEQALPAWTRPPRLRSAVSRDGLRGKLEAYRSLATNLGLVEVQALVDKFARAFEALDASSSDLTLAARLVEEYANEVIRSRDAGGGINGPV